MGLVLKKILEVLAARDSGRHLERVIPVYQDPGGHMVLSILFSFLNFVDFIHIHTLIHNSLLILR